MIERSVHRNSPRIAIWAWILVAVSAATHPPAIAQKSSKASQKSASAASNYVGSEACSRCHLEIANSFGHTSMGRSLTQITPQLLKTIDVNANYYDAKSGHTFEVHAADGKLFQTEYQTDAAGKDIFRNTHAMDWLVGTGENGFGALLRRDGYLFQAPLSYYTKAAKWELSPGYQNGDYGFNRVILPGCIYCHSGRPQPVAGYTGKYEATPFTQTAVGCENCHGPGSGHVEAMGQGLAYFDGRDSYAKQKDPTIVNPAALKGQLADDICMSCHQTGDARVLRPGKTYQDFRPGKPLDETVSIFQIPPTKESPPQDDHVEHYYSMSLSKCFRVSNSPMWSGGGPGGEAGPKAPPMRCISCHDPHVEPSNAEAPAYFKGKCLSCHTEASCTATPVARHQTSPADNCISCHMPKRAVRVISHSSDTNHRIITRPEEPFPEETFHQTSASMPDLIHLNPAGSRDPKTEVELPAMIRLQAYALLQSRKPAFAESWRKTLAELETQQPENALVQAALGHRDLQDRKLAQAETHLQHALKLDPLQPAVYSDLSEVEEQNGRAEDAIASARKAVELDPFNAPLQKTLVSRLISGKQYEGAQAAMEKYLQLFPEDDFMRKMLAMAKD